MTENHSSSPPDGTTKPSATPLSRRTFLRSSTAASVGAGLIVTSKTALGQTEGSDNDLKIGIVGCGAEGDALMNAVRQLENVRFIAVCDIWDYARNAMAKRLKAYKMPVNDYVRFEEMLEKEKDLDAVLIAVPDFLHHTYSIMAMDAGLDVYCEKMMSNTIENAREMVLAQRRTGKLLQIGHQRRSNPRYMNAHDNVAHGHKLLGWITHAYAQWNRAVSEPLGFPKKYPLDPAIMAEFGFENMLQFRNWRMFKKFGGGIISDLGAHQIDLFNWFYKTPPKSVIASGGIDFYPIYEQYDNIMTIYEYDIPHSQWDTANYVQNADTPPVPRSNPDHVTSRAYYQVLTTTASEGFYEKFLGQNGSIVINETGAKNSVYQETGAPDEEWQKVAAITPPIISKEGVVEDKPVYNKFWEDPMPWTRPEQWMASKSNVDVRVSKSPSQWELAVKLDMLAHAPHLDNFFQACRKKGTQADLNCPAEEGYKTAVTVLKVNEAIATGQKIEFKPEDFVV
jgi:predicted dehydrogenase